MYDERMVDARQAQRRGWWLLLAVGVIAALWLASGGAATLLEFKQSIAPAYHQHVPAWLQRVFLLEYRIPARERTRFFHRNMLFDFFGWFCIGNLVSLALTGAYTQLIYDVVARDLAWTPWSGTQAWPAPVRYALAFVAVDFLLWVSHWLRHKIPVFWAFHTIHHSQRKMNMFTESRVHFVELLISTPISVVPMFLLGLNIELSVWTIYLMNAYSHIYHANVRSNYGPLRYLLITPQSHRVHHSREARHRDHNFGVIFCVWDRLFGTYCRQEDVYPETGIDDDAFPSEADGGAINAVTVLLRQLIYPLRLLVHAAHGGGWSLSPAKDRESNTD